MHTFRQRTALESLLMLWPPYRLQREAETREAIRWLVANPDAPCRIGGELIANGYGAQSATTVGRG